MNQKESKKNQFKGLLLPISILTVAIIVFVFSLSYGYFDFSIDSEEESSLKVIGTDFKILITNTSVNINNIHPIYDSHKTTEASTFDFSVENQSRRLQGCYSLSLVFISEDEEIRVNEMNWELLENTTIISSGTFADITNNQLELLNDQDINVGERNDYELRIWLTNSTTVNQSNLIGKTIETKILLDAIAGACN